MERRDHFKVRLRIHTVTNCILNRLTDPNWRDATHRSGIHRRVGLPFIDKAVLSNHSQGWSRAYRLMVRFQDLVDIPRATIEPPPQEDES